MFPYSLVVDRVGSLATSCTLLAAAGLVINKSSVYGPSVMYIRNKYYSTKQVIRSNSTYMLNWSALVELLKKSLVTNQFTL